MARKREREETELDIVTLLNVMVVLIAFLILTAVFTQVTIQELKLPAQAGDGVAPLKPPVVVEVFIRKTSLQISNGKKVTETINTLNGTLRSATMVTSVLSEMPLSPCSAAIFFMRSISSRIGSM